MGDAQETTLDRKLAGNPFDGFGLLFKSRYLLLLSLFILLMTWISTIVYFQLGDLISKAFASREARTQAYAVIDLIVNEDRKVVAAVQKRKRSHTGSRSSRRRCGATATATILDDFKRMKEGTPLASPKPDSASGTY